MLNKLLRMIHCQVTSVFPGMLYVFGILFLLPGIGVLFINSDSSEKLLAYALAVILLVAAMEVFFRVSHRIYFGRPYYNFERIPFDKILVEPHPYISYVMKRHALTSKRGPATYPLHKGKYSFLQLKTNNLGFANGPDGGRDVAIPKPKGLFRINCIGASTTGNYIEFERAPYSYPLELEKILRNETTIPLEVNNCGQGGYNTADILTRFLLQVVDTQPDLIVIYHAYNDILAYLTADFLSDYSHSRVNLGENYWKLSLAARIPSVPIKFINYLLQEWFSIDLRNSLIHHITKGEIDTRIDPKPGLLTYQRNLQHIIDICKNNHIKVVLSTYCHFLYPEIENESLHLCYRNIVSLENEVMLDLAKRNKLLCVDNARLIPEHEAYFVDSVHFTPEGMQMIAGNFARVIMELLKRKDA